MDFDIKLDTNGSDPDLLQSLIDDGLVNYVAMDIKASLDERYHAAAGVEVNLDDVKKSISVLMGAGIGYEFRTTVVPTLVETEDVVNIAKFIEGAKRYVLQQFVGPGSYKEEIAEIRPFERGVFNEMVMAASPYVGEVLLRGNVD